MHSLIPPSALGASASAKNKYSSWKKNRRARHIIIKSDHCCPWFHLIYVFQVRRQELGVVRRSAVVRAGLSALLGVAPTLVFAVTLLAYSSLQAAKGAAGLRPSTVETLELSF